MLTKRHVPLPAFDPTDVSPIQLAHIRKGLLGHPELLPPSTQGPAKPNANIQCHLRLRVILEASVFMCPRTMSIIALGDDHGLQNQRWKPMMSIAFVLFIFFGCVAFWLWMNWPRRSQSAAQAAITAVICSSCGKYSPDNVAFCGHCGKKLLRASPLKKGEISR